MSRIVNELDSIHFSIKKASKMVKEIGRQVIFQNIHFVFFHLPGLAVIGFTYLKVFPPGCNWQVHYGITLPCCYWSHSNHYSEGISYTCFLLIELYFLINEILLLLPVCKLREISDFFSNSDKASWTCSNCLLFGVGRYLSRITSFEIEPPSNKLSFRWPSHIHRSVRAERNLKEFWRISSPPFKLMKSPMHTSSALRTLKCWDLYWVMALIS